MARRTWILNGLLALALSAGGWHPHTATAQKKTPSAGDDPRTLTLEVSALQSLHQLQLTPSQLQVLSRLCKGAGSPLKAQPQARVSPKFRKTVLELRQALAVDNDERIDELSARLDKLFDDEKVELEDHVSISEAARRKAPEFVRLLQPTQAAALVGTLEEEALDPLALLSEVVDKGRSLPATRWQKLRDDVADEVAWLTAGGDARGLARKLGAVLDRQRALKPAASPARHAELEKEIAGLLGRLDPFEILRHAVEREMAELLSNPQLPQAIQTRLQAARK